MCELFGVNTPRKIQLNHLLNVFFSHGDRHPHGWGMAFFENNTVQMEKQAVASTKSARLREYSNQLIMSDKMIAHIRLATKGNMEYENCHPFIRKDATGRTWTLAHNGTVFEGELMDSYFYVQGGQTDSERILYLLVDRMNDRYEKNGYPSDASVRFRAVDDLICDIADGNKLNLLFFDGEYFYVHTNCRDSLFLSKRQGGYVFSTVPLDEQEWRPLPLNTLLAFQDGRLVQTGTDHGCEYVEDPEKIRMLFLDYSTLYMNVALGVVSRNDHVVKSLDDWNKDDKIIIISGTTAETYLTENYPDIPLQKFDSYATAKEAFENGTGIAWANDNTEVIAFSLQNDGYTVGIPSLGSNDTIAPAVSKGNTTLLEWINEDIKKLGEEQFFHKDYDETLTETYGDEYKETLVVEGGKSE